MSAIVFLEWTSCILVTAFLEFQLFELSKNIWRIISNLWMYSDEIGAKQVKKGANKTVK